MVKGELVAIIGWGWVFFGAFLSLLAFNFKITSYRFGLRYQKRLDLRPRT